VIYFGGRDVQAITDYHRSCSLKVYILHRGIATLVFDARAVTISVIKYTVATLQLF